MAPWRLTFIYSTISFYGLQPSSSNAGSPWKLMLECKLPIVKHCKTPVFLLQQTNFGIPLEPFQQIIHWGFSKKFCRILLDGFPGSLSSELFIGLCILLIFPCSFLQNQAVHIVGDTRRFSLAQGWVLGFFAVLCLMKDTSFHKESLFVYWSIQIKYFYILDMCYWLTFIKWTPC